MNQRGDARGPKHHVPGDFNAKPVELGLDLGEGDEERVEISNVVEGQLTKLRLEAAPWLGEDTSAHSFACAMEAGEHLEAHVLASLGRLLIRSLPSSSPPSWLCRGRT
jgi:hypothetical protein